MSDDWWVTQEAMNTADERDRLLVENERLRAALREIAQGYEWSGSNCRETAEAALGVDEQFPVSLAEMRQPEEREKNAAMKAAVEAIGQLARDPIVPID